MLRHLTLAAVLIAASAVGALADPAPDAPAIILAAFKGDAAKVRKLLVSGVSPDTRDGTKFTALNWAAYAGRLAMVKLLVEAKADINANTSQAQWTPMMNAIGGAHAADVALYLIEQGADVTLTDYKGYSALSFAAMAEFGDVAKRLIARGGDSASAVALIKGVIDGDKAAIGFLIDNGANMNAAATVGRAGYSAGDTALLVAAQGDKNEIVSLLLARGADPNLVPPAEGGMNTALMWAAFHCNGDMARTLIARGASLSATNRNGHTALQSAQSRVPIMAACEPDVLAMLSGAP